MPSCPVVVLPSSVVLNRVQVAVADYFTLYPGAEITVYAPLGELLAMISSQEQCEKEMGKRRPSVVSTRFIPELFHVKGVLDVVDCVEADHLHREKKFFVSALNDRCTHEMQKAASVFDQKRFVLVWCDEAAQLVLVRIVLRATPWQQHIIVGIPSPEPRSL